VVNLKKLLSVITSFVMIVFLLLGLYIPKGKADDSVNLAKNKSITANSYVQGFAPQNANDGNIQTYWEASSNTYPNLLTVDLGTQQTFNRIVLKLNPSWSTGRTQDIEILGSNDNSSYSTIVARASYYFDPNTGNVVTITFSNKSYRYVRLKIYSNNGANGGQISEIEVYYDVSSSTGKYEAENAILSGGAKMNFDHTGYSGTGFVDGYWNVGATTTFNVMVLTKTEYTLTIRYANATGSIKTVSLYVNGRKIKQLRLPNLSNWDTWADVSEFVLLNAGSNAITIKYESTDSGNINIDYITVKPKDRGANLPFIKHEAEYASTNATIMQYSVLYRTDIQSEASGRRAVKLDNTGQYIEFTLTEPANAMVIRYCIPDSADGQGLNATLSMYVNNVHSQDIQLTSKYAWVYGEYPWTNNPADGKAHHFFDEVRLMFSTTYAAGTKIKLQKDSGDNAAYYIIDFVEFENVPAPISQPSNSLSITAYGATPNDGTDDKQAIINCINAAKAQGKIVWVPSGIFDLSGGPITVDNVTIKGAGMWYSVLRGSGAAFALNANNCRFYDFAIYGNTTQRIDSAPETAFDGNAGTGSIIQNIWIEHVKCGIWVNYPTDGIQILGCRIRNTFADGINLCGGTKNSTVQQCHIRNTGDDAIAIWSATWISNNPSQNNIVKYNTIECPWLANGIAIYGGANNVVEYNIVKDIVAFGGGILVSSNYSCVAFSGTTTVRYNTIERGSSYEWNLNYARGAIWINAAQQDINATIGIQSIEIYDTPYQGIFIEGPYSVGSNLSFNNVYINGAGTYGIEIACNARGSATFNSVVIFGAAYGGLLNSAGSNFTLNRGSGNIGW